MTRLGHLSTEEARAERAEIDRLPTAELVRLMNAEDAIVPAAVGAAGPAIATAVDGIVERLEAGGRLIYVGAGTAGRVGVLDASECGPTFNTDRVLGVIAGGQVAVSTASESAEDHPDSGAQAIAVLGVGDVDAVVGISAVRPHAVRARRDRAGARRRRAHGRARVQRRDRSSAPRSTCRSRSSSARSSSPAPRA